MTYYTIDEQVNYNLRFHKWDDKKIPKKYRFLKGDDAIYNVSLLEFAEECAHHLYSRECSISSAISEQIADYVRIYYPSQTAKCCYVVYSINNNTTEEITTIRRYHDVAEADYYYNKIAKRLLARAKKQAPWDDGCYFNGDNI